MEGFASDTVVLLDDLTLYFALHYIVRTVVGHAALIFPQRRDDLKATHATAFASNCP